MRKLGIPPENLDPLRYAGPRLHLTPVDEANRQPSILDRDYPLFTFWRVGSNPVSGAEGDIWYLSKFTSGNAIWMQLQTGVSASTSLRTDDNNVVTPNGGIIDVDGIVVTNGTNSKPLFTDGATAFTAIWELQVGAAITGAPADTNDAGIVSFDDTQFTVDANGFVQLVGGPGPALLMADVDFATPPGTDPVTPNGSGLLVISGDTVANGTNLNQPVATHSRAANAFNIEVQLAAAIAPTPADAFDAGISSYDNRYFTVDTNAWVQGKTGLQPGVSNLGIAYSAGTFTVQGANGTALSAANPAYVTLESVSVPGRLITIPVTANQTFTDAAGTNQISGNNFGVTAGIAWNTDMPFFIYAVPNDAENQIAFMISRTPARNGATVAGNIGQAGSALATTQGSMFSLLAITAADYAANPSLIVGSFRMRKTTTANDWTVQALSQVNVDDGIGRFQEMITFTMPVSQNGAATGKYLIDNGGTAPLFNIQIVNYKLDRSGLVTVSYDLNGDPGVGAGAGAVTLQLVTPLQSVSLTGTSIPSGNVFPTVSAGLGTITVNVNPITGQTYVQLSQFTGGSLTNASFSAGNRSIQGVVRFNLNNA